MNRIFALLITALCVAVLPAVGLAKSGPGGGGKLESRGTVTIGTDGTVSFTDRAGTLRTCVVPGGADLSEFAGQIVDVRCRLVGGVWVLERIKSRTTRAEKRFNVRSTTTTGNSGPGSANSGSGSSNSGPGSSNSGSGSGSSGSGSGNSGSGGGRP